ncbi:hypothetical protein ACHAPJ_005198 [Fusarium lateritium]
MAEILGLASSIITVVGVAGKLGTSTIRLKRLWDEVQDVPSSIRRCIEQLDLLAPAIEEMDTEFQKTRDMVQHDSAAKRSLEYSQKAVETLETLVRDMEKHINSERKSKRLLAQLKVRVKKEVIEEQQQQLNFALQLVSLSQQTYLIPPSKIAITLVDDSESLGLPDPPSIGWVDDTAEKLDHSPGRQRYISAYLSRMLN